MAAPVPARAPPILSPRLSLGQLDDSALATKAGAALAARIKERLARHRRQALDDPGEYDLDFAGGGDAFVDIVSGDSGLQAALQNARDISDQTATVAALLSILYTILPIQKITVTGVLEPQGDGGAAITLGILDGSKQKGAVRLVVPAAKDAPDACLKLAPACAVWIQYEGASLLRGVEPRPDEAVSHASVREGLDRQLEDDLAGAETAYAEALRQNDRNWAACVNLALLRARSDGTAESYASSIAILSDTLAEFRSELARNNPDPRQPLRIDDQGYYRLAYQLAAVELNAATAGLHVAVAGRTLAPAELFDEAVRNAVILEMDALALLLSYRRRERRRPGFRRKLSPQERRVRSFLCRTVMPSTDVVWAAARRARNPDVADVVLGPVLTRARATAQPTAPNPFQRRPRSPCEAEPVSYRVFYNLACFLASASRDERGARAQELRRAALGDLREALRGAYGARRHELIRWAQSDPSLAPLSNGPSAPEFAELVARYGSPTEPATGVSPRRGRR